MSDTATTEAAPTYTSEDLAKMWEALPADFQAAIIKVNDQIDEHNKNVALIRASKEEDTTKLLHEIREQNPENDPKLAKFNAEITKLNERIEALVKQANEVAQQYLPKKVSEEDVTKAQAATKESSGAIRDAIKGIETFESLMPTLKLTVHLKEIQSTRGLALIGSRGGSGETWRPRTSAIYLNDELIQKDVQQADGTKKPKSTMNILASELNKRTESKNFNTLMLQEAYLKAIQEAGGSKDNVPDEVTFTLEYEYTTDNGPQKLELPIKVVK